MKYFIMLCLCSCCYAVQAQSISYQYDAAGNRTARNVSGTRSSEEVTHIETLNYGSETPELKAFPNPVQDEFTVEVIGYSSLPEEILLFDMNGRIISRQKANGSTLFNLGGQPAGIYLIKTVINDTLVSLKVLKE